MWINFVYGSYARLDHFLWLFSTIEEGKKVIDKVGFAIFLSTFNLFFPISLSLPWVISILLMLHDLRQGVRGRDGKVLLRRHIREVSVSDWPGIQSVALGIEIILGLIRRCAGDRNIISWPLWYFLHIVFQIVWRNVWGLEVKNIWHLLNIISLICFLYYKYRVSIKPAYVIQPK